jgi:hypothetical protein
LREARHLFWLARAERRLAGQRIGYTPNLIWPRTFTEKAIRYRKLCSPDPLWTRLVDKVTAKLIAADRAGSSVVVETYQVVSDPDAIDFDRLPDQYVVKANHGSGTNLIVRRASAPDREAIRAACRKWLGQPFGTYTHESWYQPVRRQILIERLLEDSGRAVPLDFKCFVFHGRVAFIQVDFDRFTRHTRTFYDRAWRRQPWGLLYPPGPDLPRPSRLDDLIALAEQLSGGLDFIRIDLYCVNDCDLYFGEFSICPEAGWGRFWPDRSVDRMLGDLW